MSFNIDKAMRRLNQSGEYFSKRFAKEKNSESWVIFKSITLLGKRYEVEINVTFQPDSNLIRFIMPFYDDGSRGVRGDKLPVFDSLLHELNSRTNGGYFSKYTYDDSSALVFMYHLPLNRMNDDWFVETLNYLIQAFIAFRPFLDSTISKLNLSFDRKAGIFDPGRQYIIDNAESYHNLLAGASSEAKVSRIKNAKSGA